MINLHERLSEFSYGYGATREFEKRLEAMGISTTPFLPSLRDEGKLGFDVKFDCPGVLLLLQFKIGQSLKRFIRRKSNPEFPTPFFLDRPFWRYEINTAEIEGQFQMLLKAEQKGAEVYYVAPRFTDWTDYLKYYEANSVLRNSLLVSPCGIRHVLDTVGSADGRHRVVYDRNRAYVCSQPSELIETRSSEIGEATKAKIMKKTQPIGSLVEKVFWGLDRALEVKLEPREPTDVVDIATDVADIPMIEVADEPRPTREMVKHLRWMRFEDILSRSRSRNEAFALALGTEFWGLGAQLVLATVAD